MWLQGIRLVKEPAPSAESGRTFNGSTTTTARTLACVHASVPAPGPRGSAKTQHRARQTDTSA
eukprot:6486726-Alexandrium_andersonii.AAC.1